MPRSHEETFQKACAEGSVRRLTPYVPVPFASHAAADHIPPGVDYLWRLGCRFISRCTEAERLDLAAWARWEAHDLIAFASACSGTDVPVHVLAGLAKAFDSELGVCLQPDMIFSCEKVEARCLYSRLWVCAAVGT
jgi:hypothetical protein